MIKTISSDGTIKIQFPEGHSSVIIPMTKKENHETKTTLCLSTQIGCPMGCTFCYSSKTKFKRNLTFEELKQQVDIAKQHLSEIRNQTLETKLPFSSIVFMGMGEPLLNTENVIKLSEYLNEKYQFSYSKICISTSGILPEIKKIIEYKYPIQLAISLHSPSQKTRNKIMPNLKKYTIKKLIKLCEEYNKKYKQKIMIEYLMIKKLTDTKKDLQKLIDLKLSKYTNFNLIPLNTKLKLENKTYTKSDKETIDNFKNELRKNGYKCFVRESMGQDIEAACGMLK